MTNARIPPGNPPGRFPLTGPLRRRPQPPAELLDLTEEQYAMQLRDFGFSERAVQQELETFREYVTAKERETKLEPIADGPTRGKLFDAWVKTRQKRRAQEAAADEDDEDEEADEDSWDGLP